MKNAILFLMLAALLMSACQGRKSNASPSPPTTQTITPAAAKPSPTGTEATTQTVDIEDSRSEEDGGVAAKAPAKKKGRK